MESQIPLNPSQYRLKVATQETKIRERKMLKPLASPVLIISTIKETLEAEEVVEVEVAKEEVAEEDKEEEEVVDTMMTLMSNLTNSSRITTNQKEDIHQAEVVDMEVAEEATQVVVEVEQETFTLVVRVAATKRRPTEEDMEEVGMTSEEEQSRSTSWRVASKG
jgi:hypothetical protein